MRRSERRSGDELDRVSYVPRVVTDEFRLSGDSQKAGDAQMTVDQAREYLASFESFISDIKTDSDD